MILRLLKNKHYSFCSGSIQKYVIPSRIGGASHERLYEIYEGKFENKALEYYKQKIISRKKYGVTIVSTAEQCLKTVQLLKKVQNIVAWDTQTIDLDVKNESPVGNGKIICASFFAGPEYDFGNGPRVFIDNFGKNAGLLNYFKEYMEDQRYKKCWHNYGFDRHLFYNHGINTMGFGGDTMHMARLYDPSRMFGEYALSALTRDYREGLQLAFQKYSEEKLSYFQKKILEAQQNSEGEKQQLYRNLIQSLEKYKKLHSNAFRMQKVKMENLFARKKILKSGVEGKVYEFPTTLTLHTSDQYIEKWIEYSVLDTQSTFFLRNALYRALKSQKAQQKTEKNQKNEKGQIDAKNMNFLKQLGIKNTWSIYEKYWLPFGELLTDMEREGFKINLEHMKKIQQEALEQGELHKKKFMDFLRKTQKDPNIDFFNPSSNLQMQQLLHAPFKVDKQALKKIKIKTENYEEMNSDMQNLYNSAQESFNYEIQNAKKKPIRTQIEELPQLKVFTIISQTSQGNKRVKMEVEGFGVPASKITPSGLPSVDDSSLQILVGSPQNGKYGAAYDHFKNLGKQEFGKQICEALESLMKYRHIQTLLQTFIMPLQTCTDKNGRIHCSLNINTQTGRLSSKKPNLQNQPSYGKDVYKIRSAFCAEKGKKLIVADYGQLQLRVLAHLTNCQKMIQAFQSGGDFHSRTAIGMFEYVKKDIEEGKILLQWDKAKGEAPLPLLKDKYADERKKAKTVNFSIAYGKTAQGFAQDWNCSIQEAKKVINSWFNDRPEVEKWQSYKQKIAKQSKFTLTLLGRYRRLEKFFASSSKKGSMYGMGLRRAINTPVQGGAADIVIAAMVKIHKNQELKDLGWKLLLQIHDELILEGPQESAQRAFEIVKENMCHPFEKDLLIELEVDAKMGNNWYECK